MTTAPITTTQVQIVAAAIRLDGIVFTGPHHGCIIDDIVGMGYAKCVGGGAEQGFITSENRFVDRDEAAQIAIAAKQITGLKYSPTELFSEELWRCNRACTEHFCKGFSDPEREVKELQETVKKLPRTADGVPIAPGMIVYVPSLIQFPEEDGAVLVTGVSNFKACLPPSEQDDAQVSFKHAGQDCAEECDDEIDALLAFSTREAALASTPPQGESNA